MSEQSKNEREQVLHTLAQLGGKLTAEEDVVFEGRKVVLPERMDLDDAISFLREKRSEDEREMAFSRTYNYRPWDGARATMNALKKAFGMVSQRSTMGFFGPNPPQLRTIKVGVNQTEQVPWGAMAIPLLPGVTFHLSGVNHPEMGTLFAISAEGPRKYRFEIEGVFALIDEELRTNSLYRGKAFDGQEDPEFLDLSGVDPKKVVYSDEVITQFEANVWAMLEYTDELRAIGVPLKRSVLLEGPYGTGKTLGAYLTAKKATENGWSFVYCRPGRDNLQTVMATARLYQPSVVFFEDIDTVTNEDHNTDHVSRLLDIFDGVQAKGTAILCVLTTNHVGKIHKGVLRPGRLDSIIHIGELDANGIRRLIEANVPEKYLGNLDWAAVAEAMEGFLPAFVKEAVDRTLRYSIARNGGASDILVTEDFIHAARGLRPQLELMEGAHEGKQRDELSDALADLVDTAISGTINSTMFQKKDGSDGGYRLAVIDS